MRFYLDENLPAKLAAIARAQGLDITCSLEAGRNGWSDEAQLRRAGEEERWFVTRDRVDLTRLTVRFFEMEAPHAGVLIVPNSLADDDFGGLIRALLAFAVHFQGADQRYAIVYLQLS